MSDTAWQSDRTSRTVPQSTPPRFLADLSAFCRIPSVSVQPEHAADVARCAEWLAARLKRAGIHHSGIVRTPRHPIVRAEWREAPGKPTVLIYGHYDVQPAAAQDGWLTPPFEPALRGERLFARGASDDKGPILAHIFALEELLRSQGRLPMNVICLFEGEEEIGSPNIGPYLRRLGNSLNADLVVVSDTRMLGPDRPAIITGMRGQLNLELTITGIQNDLHSGQFGGAVHNPIQALCEILAQLHMRDGRIAIPGFYRSVKSIPSSERLRERREAPTDREIQRDGGFVHAWGEEGFSLYERTTRRPALILNGIQGGYTGPGTKSVIPSRASVKLGFRLVPDQDPNEIALLFKRHIRLLTPPTIQTAVQILSSTHAIHLDTRHPAFWIAQEAYRYGFGRIPVFIRSGGTIGIVSVLNRLRIPIILMGFSLPRDGAHGPNESAHLPTLTKAIATSRWFLNHLGRLGRYTSRYQIGASLD